MDEKSNKTNYKIHNDTIIFPYHFDEPLDEYYTIINRCKSLTFGYKLGCWLVFNQHIEIPMNLTSIVFSNDFNRPVVLTPNLISVTFQCRFNWPVELSRKLKFLDLGVHFNEPVCLPKYLAHLKHRAINCSYPLIINKYMNVLYLEYEWDLKNCTLPKNLHKLESIQNTFAPRKLPKNMRHFHAYVPMLNIQIFLPKNITKISFFCSSINTKINIPTRVKTLHLSFENLNTNFSNLLLEKPINLYLNIHHSSICDNLPNGMKCIELCYAEDFNGNNLPNSMCTIIFNNYYSNNCTKIPKDIIVLVKK